MSPAEIKLTAFTLVILVYIILIVFLRLITKIKKERIYFIAQLFALIFVTLFMAYILEWWNDLEYWIIMIVLISIAQLIMFKLLKAEEKKKNKPKLDLEKRLENRFHR